MRHSKPLKLPKFKFSVPHSVLTESVGNASQKPTCLYFILQINAGTFECEVLASQQIESWDTCFQQFRETLGDNYERLNRRGCMVLKSCGILFLRHIKPPVLR